MTMPAIATLAWIAMNSPPMARRRRRAASTARPAINASTSRAVAAVPKPATPVAAPRGGPREASSSRASPAAPSTACSAPTAQGGGGAGGRRCQTASPPPTPPAISRTMSASCSIGSSNPTFGDECLTRSERLPVQAVPFALVRCRAQLRTAYDVRRLELALVDRLANDDPQMILILDALLVERAFDEFVALARRADAVGHGVEQRHVVAGHRLAGRYPAELR